MIGTARQVNTVVLVKIEHVLDPVLEDRVQRSTTAHQANAVLLIKNVVLVVLENVVLLFMTPAHLVNSVVNVIKIWLANVIHLVLESRVNIMRTAHQVDPVVVKVCRLVMLANVLHRVLENRVSIITTADQMNFAVIVVKVIMAHVLKHVLENRVSMIPTAQQVNLVVVLINVP